MSGAKMWVWIFGVRVKTLIRALANIYSDPKYMCPWPISWRSALPWESMSEREDWLRYLEQLVLASTSGGPRAIPPRTMSSRV